MKNKRDKLNMSDNDSLMRDKKRYECRMNAMKLLYEEITERMKIIFIDPKSERGNFQ